MNFKFALLSAITLVIGGTLVFVSACHKQDVHSAENASTTLIANARQYFESSVLPRTMTPATANQDPRASSPKTPIWGMAYTTTTDLGDMVVVPLSIKSNFKVKTNGGNQSFSAGLFSSLVVYKDNSGSYHAELVTKIPDDSYVSNLSANKKFSGVALIEDWQGNFINGYHYANGVTDRHYTSFKIIHTQNGSSSTSPQLLQQVCTITDLYDCTSTDQGVSWTCDYAFSTESCDYEDVGGDGGSGGGGGSTYQNVYHYIGGGSGGAGGTWAVTTNVGENLCSTISFSTDASGALIANFGAVSETWSNPVQGNVSISIPSSCIRITGASSSDASTVFNSAYNYARLHVTSGLNDGSILPANVNSSFINFLGYYLHIGYSGSTWDAYSNCTVTAPSNSPSFCPLPGD